MEREEVQDYHVLTPHTHPRSAIRVFTPQLLSRLLTHPEMSVPPRPASPPHPPAPCQDD